MYEKKSKQKSSWYNCSHCAHCFPACHWRKATPRSSDRGRLELLGWPARSSPVRSTAIASTWRTTRAKARRTSTVLWSGRAATARGAARAPETESARGAETAPAPATGESRTVVVDVLKLGVYFFSSATILMLLTLCLFFPKGREVHSSAAASKGDEPRAGASRAGTRRPPIPQPP